MTEKLQDGSVEQLHSLEVDKEANKHRLEDKLEKAKLAEQIDVGEARRVVEQTSPLSRESYSTEKQKDGGDNNVHWWSRELGAHTFDRTLTSVRRRLSAPERSFSKVVHNPAVERASDIAGYTIARPQGILYGGLFSFVFSLGAYLLARHLGGELKPNFFVITFVGGYVFGLIVELITRLIKTRKR